MQTQTAVYRRGFIIYEFQVLSDNPMSHEHVVNKRIRSTCLAGSPENTCDSVNGSLSSIHPTYIGSTRVYNLGTYIAG